MQRSAAYLVALLVLLGCGAARSNTVVAWGHASRTNVPPDLTNVVAVAAGAYHSIALKADRTLAAWGSGPNGETNIPPQLTNVTAISTLFHHDLALSQDGSLSAWGNNEEGQTNIPPGIGPIMAVAAGYRHSIALLENGTVAAWGANDYGQTTIPAGLSNVTAISAGSRHNLALRADGTVAGWGTDENFESSAAAGLANIVGVAAGAGFSLALRSDGTVWAQGPYTMGQASVPAGLSNVVHLVAGFGHALALRSDGSLVAWGINTHGQTIVPVQVSNVTAMAAGTWHSVAVTEPDLQQPFIVRQPSGTRVFRGSRVLLSVGAVCATSLNYQWQHAGTNIPLATNAVLEISAITTAMAGDYRVEVGSAGGTVLSSNATLHLDESAPYIVIQPESDTAYLGGPATFKVQAFGSGPLAYQWLFNDVPIPNATHAALDLLNLAYENAGDYRVVISNELGVVTSQPAHLGVANVVLWDSWEGLGQKSVPADLTNAVALTGGTLGYANPLWKRAFTVATRADNTLTTWGSRTDVLAGRSNLAGITVGSGHALGIRPDGTIETWGSTSGGLADVPVGATNIIQVAAGSRHSLALRNDGQVFGWGWDGDGQASLPSDVGAVRAIAASYDVSAVIRMDGTLRAWGWTDVSSLTNPPAWVNDAIDVAVGGIGLALRRPGTTVSWGGGPTEAYTDVVAIACGGAHRLALKSSGAVVTWGQWPGWIPPPIGSAPVAQPPADLPPVSSIAAGDYHSALVLDRTVPLITQDPLDAALIAGSCVLFRSTAVGGMPLSLQWRKDGTNIPNATWPTLVYTNLTPSHAGSYQLIASNAFGMASSRTALLTVIPLEIISHPTDRTVYGGEATTLSVAALGPDLTYQWKHNGSEVPDATNSSLTLSDITTNGAGDYAALIGNAFGSAESSNALVTVIPIEITTPVSSLTRFAGESVGRSVSAIQNGPFTYQWMHNSVELPDQTNNLLFLNSLASSQSGTYSVRVANPYGSDTADILQLTVVDAPPFITTQPPDRRAWVNGSASYTVAAAGAIPLSYRWFEEPSGTPLNSGTRLSLFGVNLGSPTGYVAQVSNSFGTVYSRSAALEVLPVVIWPPNDYGAPPPTGSFSNVVALAAGADHAMALHADGSVAAWGDLGGPSGNDHMAVACGESHSMTLRTNGAVYAWGANSYGQASVPPGLTRATAIACGTSFSCAVNSRGGIVAWGRNTVGQTSPPTDFSGFSSVACGNDHGLGLRTDGTVAAWGLNSYGQTNVPSALSNVVQVAAGALHSVALLKDGTVFAWGFPSATNVPPTATNIVSISAGALRTLALRADGTLVSWGAGDTVPPGLSNITAVTTGRSGQGMAVLGTGTPTIARQPLDATTWRSTPALLSAGVSASAPVAYQWRFNGTNLAGATNSWLEIPSVDESSEGAYQVVISNGTSTVLSRTVNVGFLHDLMVPWGEGPPTAVPSGLTGIRTIDAGDRHAVALLDAGSVFAWGTGFSQTNVPAWATNVVAISAGDDHTIALRSDGTVGQWGTIPGPIPADLSNVVAISASDHQGLALLANGTMQAWGGPAAGQDHVLENVTNVVSISSGSAHHLALRADGTVVAWGSHWAGSTNVPADLSNVVALAAGRTHSLALRNDGVVVGWGDNEVGQLTPFPSLSNAVMIAAGHYHSLALTAEGRVVGWGLNNRGQTDVPVGLRGVIALAAGGDSQLTEAFSLALIGEEDPQIVRQPNHSTQTAGFPLLLSVGARSQQPLAFQWHQNGTDLPGATNSWLRLDPAHPGQSGLYSVTVSNALGSMLSDAAQVTVLPAPPLILQHPSSLAVSGAEPVLFSVLASGSPPLSYAWRKDVTVLPGETDAQLVLTNLTRAHGGYYSVTVSNEFGTALSQEAHLRVIVPQNLSLPERLPDGTVLLKASDADGGNLAASDAPFFTVWTSSNLVDWVAAGIPLTVSNGVLWIRDIGAGTEPQRFYRVSEQLTWRIPSPQFIAGPLPQPEGGLALLFGDSNGTRLTAADMSQFTVQASTNLVEWSTLTNTLTLTNGHLWFVDPAAGQHPRRFYRVVEHP